MFTYHYSQPAAYRFSLDSIYLAEFVADHVQPTIDWEEFRVLDLCAGCGVIGIELSWYVRDIRFIDFMEVQDTYTSHFQQNVLTVNRPELQLNWYLTNYDVLLNKNWQTKYHLIISNPPYFQQNQGMLSPSEFKNRCRFFIDSTFNNYILAIIHSLAPNGQAYFLLRPLKQHGENLFNKVQQLISDTAITAEIITQIRGTDVVLLQNNDLNPIVYSK